MITQGITPQTGKSLTKKALSIKQHIDIYEYTYHSGLALTGLCINRFSQRARVIIGLKIDKHGNIISHTNLLRSYLTLRYLDKNDDDAKENRILLQKTDKIFYIAKWNSRREDSNKSTQKAFPKIM